jgi:hypothetical protein
MLFNAAEEDVVWLSASRERTAEVLRERKALKRKMGLASAKFNSEAKDWIEFAQDLGWVGCGHVLCCSLLCFHTAH